MKKMIKLPFAATVLSLALIGCASKGGIEVKEAKPNPLPKIQATQALNQVFSNTVSSSPKHDSLHLQLDRANNVYYSADPDGEVAAYDGKKQLWEVRPTKDLTAGVSVGGNVAVVGSRQGKLIALNAQTGETLWTQQLSGSILSPSLIEQNRVVTITNDGTVYTHDAQSGQMVWTFDLPNTPLSVRGYAMPTLLDSRTVGIATANAYIYALDLITGVPRWQRRVAVSEGRGDIARLVDIDSRPVVVDDNMVSVSYQGQVTVVDLASQRVRWTEKASSLSSPAADSTAVYVANSDGRLVAYNLADGVKLWENDQLLHRGLSNPVLLGGVLVVGDYDGVLHLIDPTTGQLHGRAETKGQVNNLRVEDDLLYVSTDKGHYTVWQNLVN